MKITEVRIKLMENSEDRLRAFCSITFDDAFVVRDLKIIDGNSGPFVAMPSRKLSTHCPSCRSKNHLRSKYCNHCGNRISRNVAFDDQGRAKLYADIAHPINPQCREMIQNHVLEEFEKEKERAQQPGYVSNYDDAYESLSRSDTEERRTIRIDPGKSKKLTEDPDSGPHPPIPDTQSSAQETEGKSQSEGDAFGNGIFD